VVVVAVVVQCYAVEFFKRVGEFAHRRCEARIEGNALDSRRTNVYALAFLDVAEVGRLDTGALVRNNRRFHMTKKRPLRGLEEGCGLDVRGTSPRAQSFRLVLDQKLANQSFAETRKC
jgi:hypothetical protein